MVEHDAEGVVSTLVLEDSFWHSHKYPNLQVHKALM